MSVFCKHMGGVGGKILCGHFRKHRKSIPNTPSKVDMVCHDCLGGNGTIHDQILRKHYNEKLKTEDSSWNKITRGLHYMSS